MKFTFGTDPEFVLLDGTRPVSAIGILPGKEAPLQLGRHAAYYDNVLVECAIAPADSRSEAVDNIQDCLRRLAKAVHPLKIACIAAIDYEQKELNHIDAQTVGCNPERCAYTLQAYAPDPAAFKATTLRTGGGHVHLGADWIRGPEIQHKLVHMLDISLGLKSVFWDTDPTSVRRRELYGKAGRFRPTEYGLEYRTLGNFWLSSPDFVKQIWDECRYILYRLSKYQTGIGPHARYFYEDYAETYDMKTRDIKPDKYQMFYLAIDDIRKAVDTRDMQIARKFLRLFEGEYDITSLPALDMYKEWGL